MFDHKHYVPVLKWRQGEYTALSKIPDLIKTRFTPLLEIPGIEWDFEAAALAKTADQHLTPFAVRLKKKWGGYPAFVDLKLLDPNLRMHDGSHPVDAIFNGIRENKAIGIPVTGVERDDHHQAAIRRALRRDQNGVCVRIGADQLIADNTTQRISDLMTDLGVSHGDVDLVLDFGAPTFQPIDDIALFFAMTYRRFEALGVWRTTTIVATSFPKVMAGLAEAGTEIKRGEWLVYKKLITILGAAERRPTFGDYAIAYPELPQEDMRLLKPAATIRYTTDDAWHIVKGRNVRDNGFGQYQTHCKTVVKSGKFMGAEYSAGDKYIADCMKGTAKTGNLTTWRWVGTNHHLIKVINDVASLS